MRRAATPHASPLGAALVLAASLAGCVEDQPQAPVLGNPKLLVDRTHDNLTRIYVHSAFGERAYDVLAVAIDNETVARENDTYALVHKTDLRMFSLRVEARSDATEYAVVALVRTDGERLEVAVLDDMEYGDWREVDLPWQKVVAEAAR